MFRFGRFLSLPRPILIPAPNNGLMIILIRQRLIGRHRLQFPPDPPPLRLM